MIVKYKKDLSSQLELLSLFHIDILCGYHDLFKTIFCDFISRDLNFLVHPDLFCHLSVTCLIL